MHLTRTTTHARRWLALVAAGLATTLAFTLAACGDDDGDTTSATDEPAELRVTDVWARSSAEGQTNGAAYMVIHGGSEDDRLVAASVPETVAATAEIHETVPADDADGMGDMGDDTGEPDGDMAGDDAGPGAGDMGGDDMGDGMGGDTDDGTGTMTMREIEALDIPALDTVKLEPGGYHVMLLDLVEPLEAGDEFDIVLEFEVAGTRTVTAEVRDR